MITDIVNGKLIATGKGGKEPGTPWATLVFDLETDALLDVKWYETENDARQGHLAVIRGEN